jgi:hypothetical protein
MFLDDPHRASRYYKELHTQIGSTIFNQRHKLEPYYVSAYANYKLEFLFRNGTLPAYYKPGRYHLLMAFRYIVGGQTMPTLEQNKIQGYCNTMSERLWDDAKAAESFRNAIDAVDTAAGKASLTRDLVKTQSFTDSVRTALGVLPSRSPATNGNRS